MFEQPMLNRKERIHGLEILLGIKEDSTVNELIEAIDNFYEPLLEANFFNQSNKLASQPRECPHKYFENMGKPNQRLRCALEASQPKASYSVKDIRAILKKEYFKQNEHCVRLDDMAKAMHALIGKNND